MEHSLEKSRLTFMTGQEWTDRQINLYRPVSDLPALLLDCVLDSARVNFVRFACYIQNEMKKLPGVSKQWIHSLKRCPSICSD